MTLAPWMDGRIERTANPRVPLAGTSSFVRRVEPYDGLLVYDAAGERVGVACHGWVDAARFRPAFLKVNLSGPAPAAERIVPVDGAYIDERLRTVHLPLWRDWIVAAPLFGAPDQGDGSAAGRIRNYYGVSAEQDEPPYRSVANVA